jgi:hypothetical protein
MVGRPNDTCKNEAMAATTGPVQFSLSGAGSYGEGLLEFTANSSDILYSQRGLYEENSGTFKYDKNVWRYDGVQLSSLSINPDSPTLSYLFGEIKRGKDGRYYIPQLGAVADKLHSYSSGGFGSDVVLPAQAYQLASSWPTQVYKMFHRGNTREDHRRRVGEKSYELKDHLGNVRVVVSDTKIIEDTDASGTVSSADNFLPEVLSYSDPYPFGFDMPGRQFNSGTKYRFGFGGHEKDDEVKGSGNHLAFGDYGYDPRLGRRWNIDPMAHEMPGISPYTAFFNNPIIIQDPNGEFGIAGFLIGFAVDVGVQMLANSLAGKPITDIDYGDAFVSGMVGMFTGGMGNVGKLGKSAQKLLTAAGIEGKVASTAMKISAVVTEEGIKASIDIKVATEDGEYVNFKTVFGEGEFSKSGQDAATDFVIGTTMEVFKGGVKDVFETVTTTTLKKEEKELLQKFKQTATGSKNNLKYEAELKQVGDDINFQETISEYGAGAAKDVTGEQIKKKID